MSLPSDLLDQARTLAMFDAKKPKQANLRRSLSSAYYALFHFLSDESVKNFIGAGQQNRMHRDLARRAIAHTRLKDVCQEFLKQTPKDILKPYWQISRIPEKTDLGIICNNLINLQIRRHEADYDFTKVFTRSSVLDDCDRAQEAMEAWRKLKRQHPEAASLFAMCILLWAGLSGR